MFRIKQERERSGFTQKELAEKLGITREYLSAVENNHKEPSMKLLQQIAKVLDVPFKNLIEERSA